MSRQPNQRWGPMSLSNGQKRALHAAAREAGVDEPERRLIQQSIGGFFSAADKTASRVGFIRCMAVYEWRCGGKLRRSTPGYWHDEAENADPLDGLRWRIARVAEALGFTPADVDAFLASKKMSSGRYGTVRDAPRYWLSRLLDALHAIHQRTEVRHGPDYRIPLPGGRS